MKRIGLVVTLLSCLALPSVFANERGEALSLFYQANASYGEEDFKKAIAGYEEILALGFESGALYYNLGNAYFKNGSLGKAIVNYRRAARYLPRDADVKANLSYAQSLIKGGPLQVRRTWFIRLFYSFAQTFSLNEITAATSLLYLALAVSIILFILFKEMRKPLAYVCGLLFLLLVLCFSAFLVQYNRVVVRKEAVVVVEQTDSRFEPFGDATTFFTLREGESIVVVKSKDEWVKVRRADGKQGWIKKSDIEFL